MENSATRNPEGAPQPPAPDPVLQTQAAPEGTPRRPSSVPVVNPLLRVRDAVKVYGRGEAATRALSGLDIEVASGEFVAIMGASGSGKTTLLNCIATIDSLTSGTIELEGQDIARLRARNQAQFRRDKLGFVFQDSDLIETLTGFENISLALSVRGMKAADIEKKVDEVAKTLDVVSAMDKYPVHISAGELGTALGGDAQKLVESHAYIGLVFAVAVAAILAVQQLSETIDSMRRYRILMQLGCDKRSALRNVRRSARDYTVYFATLAFALCHCASMAFVAFSLLSGSDPEALLLVFSWIVRSGLAILIVYFGYMVLTYFSCRRILKGALG